ncbi:MAG TPA: pitrilysin family protein [Thermoanaerobaculia bacterium]|nr:pitrilysin family protein [Thermoanaerobaculia bacterium]
MIPPTACIPGRRWQRRLANGLEVCVLENRQAPIVTTALIYRAGTRDEPPGHGGVAHFLEHMMFKGSARYGPGEIDRRTQALGGVNNAVTSHDATIYYFNFAADRWPEALAIEADRMAGLTLDPTQVASERQVILEEIAMYEDEPWDALEMAVEAGLFSPHPYGRPVLGTRPELLATGEAELRSFHRRFYRPDNAVLVVAGDVGEQAVEEVARHLEGLPPGADQRAPASPPQAWPPPLQRLERRKGEVARLLLALPAPAGSDPDMTSLRLLATVLAGGRASRLHRALVDEGKLCVWVTADVTESLDAGHFTMAAEVVPGVEPERVESELLRQLAALVANPPSAEETERARQVGLADWVFEHERVHQQALSIGAALALFDPDHLDREMRRLLAADPRQLLEAAARYLSADRGVVGWSLPRPRPCV